MTFGTPTSGPIIGTAQVASSENISVFSAAIPTSKLTHQPPSRPLLYQNGHSIAPVTTQDVVVFRGDVVPGKVLLTPPPEVKQPRLGALPAGLILPTDRPGSHEGPFVSALFPVALKHSTLSRFVNLAHDLQSDLPTTVLVAWIIILSRLSGQETITLDVGRSLETRNTMNLSTLVVDCSGEPNTSELFARVKQSLDTARAHQGTSSNASFYSSPNGLSQPLSDGGSMSCFLELHLVQDKKTVNIDIRYASRLYHKETIERYAGYLKATLVNMEANRTLPAATFDILSAAEKELILKKWNDTSAIYPAEHSIHHLFENQVEKFPEAIAIIHDERKLTYLELNSLANYLAHQISQAGVAPGDYVALLFERSIELVVTELAVLKAGAAYVPIDTTAPEDRQVFMVLDTASKLLVTSEGTRVPNQTQAPVLRFNARQQNTGYVPNANRNQASSLDTAYVKFTSGTTGAPKGVVAPHCAITSAVINNGCTYIGQEDCVALALNPAFIPSTFDLWTALLNGARVVIIDEDTRLNPYRLADALVRYRVTYIYLTAPLLVQYAHVIGETLSNLRYLFSGGEQGQIKAFSVLQQHDGPVRLMNRYGSTEMSSGAVYTATHEVGKLDRLPIGRPSSNRRAYILDQYRNPVPIGALGELYIGGPGLATRYLNHPDLTAEKFLPDPFSDVQNARMFKSGDLARYLPGGNLVCAGRTDDLVKIRAYRVELGEIQGQLVGHPRVRNAAVIAVGEEGEKRLVAYVEADDHYELADSLREYISRMLPDYMIPAAFVCMDVLPLTRRGKVDRRALPEPDFGPSTTRDYVEPQGEIEIALAEMWSELLKISTISRHDNFFKLGGHSILAMRLMNLVAATFGPQLPMSEFFTSPTLQDLAKAVTTRINQGESANTVIPHVSRDSLLEPSFAQLRLWIVVKSGGASDNYHIHQAFRLQGALDHVSLRKALDTLYARHEALRSVFPAVDGEPTVQILPSNGRMPFETRD
ncbi:hypothetical protein BG004_001018, partial [Podila humilis]